MHTRTIQILSVVLLLGVLLWGGISTIIYLGVPVHGAVLVGETTKEALQKMGCSDRFFLCGLRSLFPMLLFTFGRAVPFFPYAVVSLLLFLGCWAWSFVKTTEWQFLRIRIRPVSLILAFLFFVWLLFTTLSVSGVGGISMRQIAEPTARVYTDASPSVLAALQRNFERLERAGCLTEIGSFANGAKAYNMSVRCMQQSFVTRVVPVFLFVLLLFFELLVLGRMALSRLRLPPLPLSASVALHAGAGACIGVAVIWFLAVLHVAVAPAAWLLVIALPLAGYRHVLYWLRVLTAPGEEREIRWFGAEALLLWLLLSYLAINFLTVIRPFPIGWDDLGSYLNRPRLMVSYGAFIHSMAPFQWEYLTSLGYLLFGYESIFGATTSMMVNWTAGVLAILVIVGCAQTFLGGNRGLLAALLYYTLPLVGHFSFADMKIDNAVFATGALATFAILLAYFAPAGDGEEQMSRRNRMVFIILSGAFAGFAFAMKPTAVMVLMAIVAVLLAAELHWSAFLGVCVLAFAVFVKKGTLDIATVLQRVTGITETPRALVFGIMAFLGAAILVGAAFLRRSRARPAAFSVSLFVAAFAVAIFPWVYHNNLQRGRILPTALELGVPNTISPQFDIEGAYPQGDASGVRSLPADLAVDKSQPACTPTGGKEELDRYWGYRTDWTHYVLLPWRAVLNLDSTGYYVTTSPFLFLFPLVFLLPYCWMRRGRWLLWLGAATVFLIAEWMFLANGILWYGIGMFFGIAIAAEALVARAPDVFSRTVAGTLIAVALVSNFGQRIWQYEYQRNLLEYPFGKISAEALQERTISHYDDIAEEALRRNRSMPDRPYVYRMGTFIPYFIPRNLEILGISDHQLDFFNCLNAERDHVLTLKRLQTLGFNSIVFDTNTATIEKDPNGSLHQKVNAFLDFVNDNAIGVTPAVNDLGSGIAYILLP